MSQPLQAHELRPRRNPRTVLRSCRILVVEDEYIQAETLRQELEDLNAEVLGPVPSVAGALALLSSQAAPPDAALLDLNLGGEIVFPLAEALRAKGIPFIFTTGYDHWAMPPAYAHIPLCEKPFGAGDCLWTLFGQVAATQQPPLTDAQP